MIRLAAMLAAVFLLGAASPALTHPADDHTAGSFAHFIAQYTPDPLYTERALAANVSGSVVLRITIGRDGCAHGIQVVRRLGYGLDEAAVRAVRAWRFRRPQSPGVPAHIRLSFSPEMMNRPAGDLTPCRRVNRKAQ